MGIDKYYRKGVFPSLKVGGVDVLGAMGLPAISGTVYYVEANAGNDNNDGLSWDKAKKTLASAITASNANIAAGSRGWAARNTIFIKGDSVAEDLTVPPVKCNVIGCGSNDADRKSEIKGEHAWTGSGTLMSSGFFNIQFVNDDASAIFTIANLAGLYFENCDFIAEADSIAAIKITGDTGHDLIVNNCRFRVDSANDPFDTSAIQIETTTTFFNLVIENSYVEGNKGIYIATTNCYDSFINNNIIKAVTLCVDDNSDDVVITNNCMISAADQATLGNVLDYNAALAANNIVTGSTGTVAAPACNFGAQS